MTPAARYIATLYESCIDRGLDVEAIRLHLAAHGIRRTPGQVADDLTNVASHPAPAVLSLKQIDA